MKLQRILLLIAIVALVAVATYFGVRGKRADIIIGGKNFTEQTIVGEMAALLIEAKTDLTVGRKFDLAPNLPIQLIRKKSPEIDLYLDYTGTGYVDILQNEYRGETPQQVYQHVKKVYPEQFGLEWLSPLGFKNTYTMTMRRDRAEQLGIERISDLIAHKDSLKAAFDPSFLDRNDGYPGLCEAYGFKFGHTPGQLAIGMMYAQCRSGKVDVIDAFSTDGRIERFDLKVLDDDKKFFPPYDAAFVVRAEILRKYPKVREALELLAGKLDNKTMGRLNHAVDEEHRSERDVAKEFLKSQGLIP